LLIKFDPSAFTDPGCGPLGSIAFHELLHYVYGLHLQKGFPTTRDVDPVWACEELCFGGPESNLCDLGTCSRGAPLQCPGGSECTFESSCDPSTGACGPNPRKSDESGCQSQGPFGVCCAGACTDISSDSNNCGGCAEVCTRGACCKAACVDTSSDSNNCGGCGQACTGGACCNSGCVDTSSDPDNCGSCGARCAPGQVCVRGTCECPTGEFLCPGTGSCVPSPGNCQFGMDNSCSCCASGTRSCNGACIACSLAITTLGPDCACECPSGAISCPCNTNGQVCCDPAQEGCDPAWTNTCLYSSTGECP
jgi:hypothetical protein